MINPDGLGEEESGRHLDEGYAAALCISDHQLWFAGVRGVTPFLQSVVKDLLPVDCFQYHVCHFNLLI